MYDFIKKIIQQYIQRIILAFAGLLGILIPSFAQQYGNFPYEESFLSETGPPGILKPVPQQTVYGLTNSATFTTYGLRLTPDEFSRFGAVYLDDHEFKSENGIFIEFEYMIYGNNNVTTSENGGDGLSVFFFDAKKNPGIGAYGAGIGYAYNRVSQADPKNDFSKYLSKGINGGYMGIAFDSFGNYKGLRYQGESRVNGIPYGPNFDYLKGGVSGEYNKDSDVTIRGPMNPKALTTGGGTKVVPGFSVGYTGYPVLITQSTQYGHGFVLQENDPYAWDFKNQMQNKPGFAIRGGRQFKTPNDPGYRKAFIELFPKAKNASGELTGYLVSVMIEHDMVRDTVIYDYNFRNEITYLENAYAGTDGDYNTRITPAADSPPQKISLVPPPDLKIGFAAATGDKNSKEDKKRDNHVIKNLRIRLPRAAQANDDFEYLYDGFPSVILDPLINDFAYTGTISRNQQGSRQYIDHRSFKFVGPNGTVVSSPYVQAGKGTWKYEFDDINETVLVTFTPLSTFPLDGTASIDYYIKGRGIPYSDDAYRSPAATINVKKIINPNPTINVISNQMVTPTLK